MEHEAIGQPITMIIPPVLHEEEYETAHQEFTRARCPCTKRTDSCLQKCQDGYTAGKRPVDGENHMLVILGVVIVLIAVVIIPKMRVARWRELR